MEEEIPRRRKERIERPRRCPDCKGLGVIINDVTPHKDKPCRRCRGSGMIIERIDPNITMACC